MSAQAPQPPAPDVWKAAYLRVIAFTETPYSIRHNWWQDVTGSEPTDVSDKRSQRERVEVGEVEGARLSLTCDLARITWTADVKADLEVAPESRDLGSYIDRQDWFVGLMKKWLASVDAPLTRLAFAGRLEQPAETREAGYDRLNQYLRHVELFRDSSDFLYRINRPTASTTLGNGIAINRLTSWAVAFLTRLSASLDASGLTLGQTDEPLFSVIVDFDINNSPLTKPDVLVSDKLADLIQEYSNMMKQIATLGDTNT